jgi:hypothetical protein
MECGIVPRAGAREFAGIVPFEVLELTDSGTGVVVRRPSATAIIGTVKHLGENRVCFAVYLEYLCNDSGPV